MLHDVHLDDDSRPWLARYPRYDESLSSFLDWSAQLYGVRRLDLVRELSGGRARRGADLDAAEPLSLWIAVAERFSISLDELLKRSVQEPYWLLPSRARTAYCPLCFERDLARHRTPYFRRAWGYGLVTRCSTHCTSLCEWPSRVDGQRLVPKEWFLSPSAKHSRETPAFYLTALKQAKKQCGAHGWSEEDAALQRFQCLCDEAGLIGGRTIPATEGIQRRQRIRHALRKALGKLEPSSLLRQGHLKFPDVPHMRLPRRSRPLERNGRIWAAANVPFRDVLWRRAFLLPIAWQELRAIAARPEETKSLESL